MAALSSFLSVVITFIVMTLALWLASKFFAQGEGLKTAAIAVIVASVVAFLISLADLGEFEWLTRILILAAYSLILAIFYRTAWWLGALMGLVAWILNSILTSVFNNLLN